MAAGADGWIQYIGASLPRRPERFGALNDKVDRRSLVRNNPQNMADSIAERVQRRRNSHVEDEDTIVQASEVSLGEKVLLCELIRDGILKHFNPCKLSDLQYVLELRCFKGLVSDEDLKEMYFKRAWGFGDEEFPLAKWQELSVGEMQERVREALPWGVPLPPGMADVSSLDTKESIMREYGALAYVPSHVYGNAVRGAHVLRTIRQVGVKNMKKTTVRDCLEGACGAGMDLSLISTLCDRVMGDDDRFTHGLGLIASAMNGHTDVVNLLVGTHGANVDGVDEYGRTALIHAANRGHTDTVNALAGTLGANVDAVEKNVGQTALMLAAYNGHTDTVNALAGTHGTNVDAVDKVGQTALMLAAYNGHTDTVNALAGTHGANVDAVTIGGYTALMCAAEKGHTAIVNALAGTHGANLDTVDRYGWTALTWAARNGHTATVTALAGTHGANVDAVDNDGRTALIWAARDGHTAIVNALAGTHGANLDTVDRYGHTALMLAAMNGHTDTVTELNGSTRTLLS